MNRTCFDCRRPIKRSERWRLVQREGVLTLAHRNCTPVAAEAPLIEWLNAKTAPRAYYNEIDPFCAEWLKNLIAAGHIAPGDVDTRSIEDVTPDDLRGYTQCHFFAGIGVWSYALRRAGWPDDRPVWTGSCPCQPFSAAGKGGGFADERHLWPAWFHLIGERRPAVLFGEQVASKDGLGWLDLVQADLEGAGYACGPVDLCAAGVGAPHIRQRLWFVGRSDEGGGWRHARAVPCPEGEAGWGLRRVADGAEPAGEACGVAEPDDAQRRPDAARGHFGDRAHPGWPQGPGDAEGRGGAGELAHPHGGHASAEGLQRGREHRQQSKNCLADPLADATHGDGRRGECGPEAGTGTDRIRRWGPTSCGPVSRFWADADWLPCRDGKARPVEPGTFPLAHGAPARVGRLRAYGNAIVSEAAAAVVGAYIEHDAEARAHLQAGRAAA